MCVYEDDVLKATCWDTAPLGCGISDPPCARGHNHHSPCNRAWGRTWVYDGEEASGESLEEHVARLLAMSTDSVDNTSTD